MATKGIWRLSFDTKELLSAPKVTLWDAAMDVRSITGLLETLNEHVETRISCLDP